MSGRRLQQQRVQDATVAVVKEELESVNDVSDYDVMQEEDMAEEYLEPDQNPLSTEGSLPEDDSTWTDSCTASATKKRGKGKRTASATLSTYARARESFNRSLKWGAGPNENGVWKHFLRDSTRKYSKCLWGDCESVVNCVNGNTSTMRAHMLKQHQVSVPAGEKRGRSRY